MPDFPRYSSKGQLTTQQPSVEAPTDNTGDVIAKAGNQIGGAIQDNALKWDTAVRSARKTVSSYNLKSGILDLQQRASLENDPNKEQQYRTELEKLRAKNTEGIDKADALELNYDAKVADIQLQNHFKKKTLELDAVATNGLIDMEISSGSPDAFSNIKTLLSKKVQTGLLSATDAEKKYKDAVKTIGAFDVSNDTADQEKNSAVLAELKKGDKGKYADIPPDERLDLIKASQQRIFNNNQTYKRDTQDASNERSNQLIDKFASGEATIKDIEAELAIPEESGGIKRSQLLTYQKGVISGIKGDLDRMLQEKTPDGSEKSKRAQMVKSYLDLIDNFIDDNTDQWKAKEILAKAWQDGIINSKEQKLLNGMKQNLKDIEFNRNTGPVASAIKGIKEFFKFQSNASDEDIARNIKGLLGEINNGTNPDHAMRMTLRNEVLARIPDYATYPETGKLKRDANGNIIRVFPDGTYEEEPPRKASK